MTRRPNHLDALATLVDSALEATRRGPARRLLEHELAWLERRGDAAADDASHHRAFELLGVIESCRDTYLRDLDADDGLSVLLIDASEVAVTLRRRRRERAARARRCCPRCGDRMDSFVLRELADGRGHRRHRRGSAVVTVFRCGGCGLVLRKTRRKG
jgi:hypothetical protein